MNVLMREAPSADGLVSPELALVDPLLASAARRTLPDRVPDAGQARQQPQISARSRPELVWAPSRTEGWRTIRHQLRARAVVTTAGILTVLALVLLDVRVQVGKAPVAAEALPPVATGNSAPNRTDSTRPAQRPSPRRFAWAPVPGASAYRVVLIRGNERVFEADTPTAEITIPRQWSYKGARRRIESGEYRWIVWPVIQGKRAARAIVQSTLVEP